jgi:hypothetical protein
MLAKILRHPSIVAAFILACAASVTSQVNNAYQVSGPVKTARLDVVKVTDNNGRIVEGPRRLVELLTFDEKGKFSEQTTKNPDGSIKFKFGWKSTYDVEGRLTRQEFYNANGLQTCVASYDHEAKALQSEATFYCPAKIINHRELSFYDNKGNKVREDHTNADGTVRSSILFVYDGGLVQENYFRPDGSLRQRNVLVYDVQGNRTEFAAYDDKGGILSKFGMTYSADSRGKPAELLTYSRRNTLVSKDTYTYEFDSFGNWTRRKIIREFFEKAAPEVEVLVEYRTFTYYQSIEDSSRDTH